MNFSEARETDNYIYDMECAKYVEWVENYPENIKDIFGDLIENGQCMIKEDDLIYFMDKSINLNDMTCIIDGVPCTPLMLSCNYRNVELVEWLCKHGADPNIMDENGLTSVDMLLSGHNENYREIEHALEVCKCLEILMARGLIRKMQKWVADECCKNYMECNTINEFLRNCQLID